MGESLFSYSLADTMDHLGNALYGGLELFELGNKNDP